VTQFPAVSIGSQKSVLHTYYNSLRDAVVYACVILHILDWRVDYLGMTLGQFAVVVGAPPKWVQNTFRVLNLPNEYTVACARVIRLVRIIWETCGTELVDAHRLAQEVLDQSVRGLEWYIESADGSLAVVFDRNRFLNSFACALAKARVLYTEKRRGRPLRRSIRGIDAAREFGIDVDALESMLRLAPAERIRRMDRDLAYQGSAHGFPSTRLMRLLAILNAGGVRYVVVGDVAAGIEGSTVVPDRLEICYDRRPDNIRRLAKALSVIGAYPRGVHERIPFSMDSLTLTATPHLPLITEHGAIDVLGMIRGVGAFDRVLEQSNWHEVDGVRFGALGLEGLLTGMRFRERAVDRKRVLELETLQELRGGPDWQAESDVPAQDEQRAASVSD
jgi:hypothetical protein